jgi:pimeloyl-ACP methyl ester carboxylesterase
MLAPIKYKENIAFFEVVPTNPDNDVTYLLLHGIGTSLNFWTAVAPVLGTTSRTIALDIPGFGGSPSPSAGFSLDHVAERVCVFIESTSANNIVLVAHSLGAFVAFKVAATEPDKIRRLILVNGTLGRVINLLQRPRSAFRDPSLALHLAAYLAAASIPVPPSLVRVVGYSRLLRTVAYQPFVANPNDLDLGLAAAAVQHNGNFNSILSAVRAHNIDYTALLRTVRQPVDLAMGDEDPLVNQTDIEQAVNLVNVRRTLRIPNCGHWPMIEYPEILTSFIQSWKIDDSPA